MTKTHDTPTGPIDLQPVDGIRPHFAAARRAGDLLFLSGQLAFDANGRIRGDDIAAQTRLCLSNIAAVLAAEGCGLADLVKVTVWLTRAEDFGVFNRAYAEHFRDGVMPARSTVRSDLVVPGALIEIEAVASTGPRT